MKMLFIIIANVLLMTPSLTFAGNEGRGGIPDAIAVNAFQRYIEGQGLKLSMTNYLRTLKVEDITDPIDSDVAATFKRMLNNGNLLKDIMTATYISGLDKCGANDPHNPESLNPKVRAWTNTGKAGNPNIGGKICFDIERLVADYTAQGVTIEDAAIKLTALAYHEHVHHFQNGSWNSSIIQLQENQANAIGGYVLRTARLAQVPLVEWSALNSNSEDSDPDQLDMTFLGQDRGDSLELPKVRLWHAFNDGYYLLTGTPALGFTGDSNEIFNLPSGRQISCEIKLPNYLGDAIEASIEFHTIGAESTWGYYSLDGYPDKAVTVNGKIIRNCGEGSLDKECMLCSDPKHRLLSIGDFRKYIAALGGKLSKHP